ncbi:MAG: Uma2 family endonuclease [Jaaginema sp. PMC 1078.18]|nr:Uma2 family endonuclease [Jaaginema sp. PMC 1078.18]
MKIAIAQWTLEDYHRMIAAGVLDDKAVELVRGEIVEMSPEGEPHAYYSSEASEYLTILLGKKASIRQAKPITLLNNSEPEPDIAIVQRLGREYLTHHPYPENIFWVIEYANSSLAKDTTLKYEMYAEAGIPEYWLVNLPRRELIIFRDPCEQEYRFKMTLTEGTVTPLTFTDIEIEVAQIISP